MSENKITDLQHPINQDLEEMANAQQLLQEAVTTTDSLRERVDRMTEHAEGQYQQFESLLQQHLDRLQASEDEESSDVRSEMEEMLLSFNQENLNAQKQSNEELSSELKAVLATLTTLHEHGQNMPAELALLRESFAERTKGVTANIDAVRSTVHNDVTTLNENQLKFNADVEALKEKFYKENDLNRKLLLGLAGGVLVVLICCLLLLFKGGDANTASKQVDNTEELRSKLGLEKNETEEETGTTLDEVSEPLPDKGSDNLLSENNTAAEEPTEIATNEIFGPFLEEVSATTTPKGSTTDEKKEETKKTEDLIMPLPDDAERIISARAGYAVTYLQRKSFDRLSSKYFHPTKGVHFYPHGLDAKGYSFTRETMANAMDDTTKYRWGEVNGAPIEMTFREYYEKHIYDVDYEESSLTNYNELYASGKSGLSFAQIEKQFPGCIFADFYKGGKSLILVFEKPKGRKSWYISAVIHNE